MTKSEIRMTKAAPSRKPEGRFGLSGYFASGLREPGRGRGAFTLVELLVVIAIIGILAALVLTGVARVRVVAQKRQAQIEIAGIVSAVHEYERVYGRFPVSKSAADALNATGGGDFTFGTHRVQCSGQGYDLGMGTPDAANPLPLVARDVHGAAVGYQANNSEVIGILMDLERFNNGAPTANPGHVKNPKRTSFLPGVKLANDNQSPGIGKDGVYRDPWGNPYIITIDFNNDDKTRDDFYRLKEVSQQAGQAGYNGLFNMAKSDGNDDRFDFNDVVMVWSAGPDKTVAPTGAKANAGVNKDNICSWKAGN